MSTSTQTEQQAQALVQSISNATTSQVDGAWAILKYKEIGIYRKIASLCELLNLNTNLVLNELPQDDEGRILDYKTRHIIHDALLQAS